MKPLVDLSTPDLCKVISKTAAIFSDAYVLDALSQTHRAINKDKSTGNALSVFADILAPVLLGKTHNDNVLAILKLRGVDVSSEPAVLDNLFATILLDEEYAALLSAVITHGENEVLAAIYKHGVPPLMTMLTAYLDTRTEERTWRSYMANMSALIARAAYRSKDNSIPFYSEITKKTKTVKDSRSETDILEDVKKKLKNRKGKKHNEDFRNVN